MQTLTISEIKEIQDLLSRDDFEKCAEFITNIEDKINKHFSDRLEYFNQIEYPLQVTDNNADVQRKYKIAVDQQRNKNYPDAVNTLTEALSLNPGNSRLKEWLATIYLKQGDIGSARRVLEKEIPETYNSFAKVWNLCHIYYRENDFPKILNLLKNSLELGKLSNSRITKLMQLSIAAAVQIAHNEYLVENLCNVDEPEALALGFLISYRKNNQPSTDRYKLMVIGGKPKVSAKIPDINQRLTQQEAFDLAERFIQTNSVPAGIHHFKGRKKVNSVQLWVLNRILGNLHAANKQYDEAIECYIDEFNISEKNKNLHPSVKSKRLKSLLEFCRTHKLWNRGLLLLQRAPQHKIEMQFQKQLKEEFEKLSRDINNGQALNILLESMGHLQKIKNVETAIREVDLIKKYCETLVVAYGSEASSATSFVYELITEFQNFCNTTELASKTRISHNVLEKHAKFEGALKSITSSRLQELMNHLKRCLRYVINDIGAQTNSLPNLDLKILNNFLPSDVNCTSIVVELYNNSKYNITSTDITLKSLTGGFEIQEEKQNLLYELIPGVKKIIQFAVTYRKLVPNEILALQATFSTNNLENITPEIAPQTSIPVKQFENVVSDGEIQNRYISVGSIPSTRPENFHGRNDILRIIRASISGGELREALFLSGLRRIGKTSVLQFLLGNPPPNTIPIYIRLDRYTPKTTGEFLLSILKEIEKRLQGSSNGQYQSYLPFSYQEALREFDAHPATVFSDLLYKISNSLGDQKMLLMFDEFQVVTEEIAKNRAAKLADRISTDALDIIRAHIEDRTFFALLTGSLLFDEIRYQIKGYDRLWGSIKVRDVAFIDQDAVGSVLREPMKSQGVLYTESAVERVMEYTKGYPVFVQLIGVEIVNILNKEKRLTVTPQDVDLASKNITSEQGHLFQLWWDEKRLENPIDYEIIKYIIYNQEGSGKGVDYTSLVRDVSNVAYDVDVIDKRIRRLKQLHIVELLEGGICRINALMLEKWLVNQLRVINSLSDDIVENLKKPVVGIFMDYENIYFGLKQLRDEKSQDKEFLEKTETKSLAMKILDRASRYGDPREKWAVADWLGIEPMNKEEHQRIFRKYSWRIEIPLITDRRKEKSDHALRDLVHEILDGRKLDVCILISGDGDFSQLVTYLIDHGKKVVVWGMKGKIHSYYKEMEKWGKIEIGYIDDILFGE